MAELRQIMTISGIIRASFIFVFIFAVLTAYASDDTAASAAAEPYRRYEPEPERWHDPFGVYYKDARPVDFIYLLPASVGGTIFSTAGFAVMWPGKLIWNCCAGDFSEDALFPPIDFSQKYCGTAGCYVLGSPFWLLEKMLYEVPVWLYESCFGSCEAGVAADASGGNRSEASPVEP